MPRIITGNVYTPSNRELLLITPDGDIVDKEELDCVSEFMDDYTVNLERQITAYDHKIIPISCLMDDF